VQYYLLRRHDLEVRHVNEMEFLQLLHIFDDH